MTELDSPVARGECWCGSTERAVRFRTPKFGLLECSGCGTLQIDPPPVGNEEDAAGFYTDYYSDSASNDSSPPPETGRTGLRSRFWRVAEKVPSLWKAEKEVLDFGCGEGTLCGELRAVGWPKVTGIDVSRSRVSRARARHPGIEFDDRGSAALESFKDRFDLVIMDNVVEHLSDPVGVLERLRRTLRAGGSIVLVTPNMESGRFRLLGRRWTAELSPHAHIFLFKAHSLGALLNRAGLQVQTTGNFLLPLNYRWGLSEFARTHRVKDLVWRLGQETGGLWGHLTGAGEMVFAVGTRTD